MKYLPLLILLLGYQGQSFAQAEKIKAYYAELCQIDTVLKITYDKNQLNRLETNNEWLKPFPIEINDTIIDNFLNEKEPILGWQMPSLKKIDYSEAKTEFQKLWSLVETKSYPKITYDQFLKGIARECVESKKSNLNAYNNLVIEAMNCLIDSSSDHSCTFITNFFERNDTLYPLYLDESKFNPYRIFFNDVFFSIGLRFNKRFHPFDFSSYNLEEQKNTKFKNDTLTEKDVKKIYKYISSYKMNELTDEKRMNTRIIFMDLSKKLKTNTLGYSALYGQLLSNFLEEEHKWVYASLVSHCFLYGVTQNHNENLILPIEIFWSGLGNDLDKVAFYGGFTYGSNMYKNKKEFKIHMTLPPRTSKDEKLNFYMINGRDNNRFKYKYKNLNKAETQFYQKYSYERQLLWGKNIIPNFDNFHNQKIFHKIIFNKRVYYTKYHVSQSVIRHLQYIHRSISAYQAYAAYPLSPKCAEDLDNYFINTLKKLPNKKEQQAFLAAFAASFVTAEDEEDEDAFIPRKLFPEEILSKSEDYPSLTHEETFPLYLMLCSRYLKDRRFTKYRKITFNNTKITKMNLYAQEVLYSEYLRLTNPRKINLEIK